MHCGRAQNPVRVGQLEPVVSVIVTQVGDPEADVVDQPRTMVGQATQANVEDLILNKRDGTMSVASNESIRTAGRDIKAVQADPKSPLSLIKCGSREIRVQARSRRDDIWPADRVKT